MSYFLKKKNPAYAVLSIEWYMPEGYEPIPPNGRRILWAACIPWPYQGNYMEILPYDPPEKYFLTLSFDSLKKRRRFSAEAKANIRRKRLEARVRKKMPLFFDWAVEQEIRKKPDYFDPAAIARRDIQHRKELQHLSDQYDRRWETINQVCL